MIQLVIYIKHRQKQNSLPNLVTFSGMAESEQRKTGAGSDQVVEKDKADNRMEEGEHLLDESDSEDALATAAKAHPGNPPDNMKESAAVKTSTNSVGQLASNFMKNVRVGCNEVFTNQNCSSLNTADKAASSRMIGTAGKPDMAGLPREYEMVRAAQRNWLSSVALSGIGPLSRKLAAVSQGYHTGSFIVESDARHLQVQNFHSLKDKLNVSMSFEPKGMICVSCNDSHAILSDSSDSAPVCVVLADQNFSPFVPAGRGEKCLLVVRVEDGLLSDLECVFKDVFRNFCRPLGYLPLGSVVLLGSISHLSLLGLSTYAEEYVRTNNSLISARS